MEAHLAINTFNHFLYNHVAGSRAYFLYSAVNCGSHPHLPHVEHIPTALLFFPFNDVRTSRTSQSFPKLQTLPSCPSQQCFPKRRRKPSRELSSTRLQHLDSLARRHSLSSSR
jgi:hypothetical protein